MKSRKNTLCIILTVLLCALLFSACSETMDTPDDLPDDTDAILLQTVDSRFGLIYITGMAVKYDSATKQYTPLNDRVYKFPLCGDEDVFSADFWEPGAAGSTSRTQYYGVKTFLSGYYNTAVKRNAFWPTECDYEFNEAGELTWLSEKADLSGVTGMPEPEPEPEPEPRPFTDTEEWPDDPAVELLAEDADLSGARDIVLEPDTPPYNLGGWKAKNIVGWEFYIEQAGDYTIGVAYSRPYTATDVWGTVKLYTGGEPEPKVLAFYAEATSPGNADWSVYHYVDTMDAYLEAGGYRLEIIPGTAEYPFREEYFINLRGVMLVPKS